MNKEFMIEKLNDIIESMQGAKCPEIRKFYFDKAQGFIEALYFGDIFDDEEFDDITKKLLFVFMGV